jgi:hypothetical protein
MTLLCDRPGRPCQRASDMRRDGHPKSGALPANETRRPDAILGGA